MISTDWKVTTMSLDDKIIKEIRDLPESKKAEVLDFVGYLKARAEDRDWSMFSLSAAMRGMEDEDLPYSLTDLQESF